MKIPTGFCVNTFRKELICPDTAAAISSGSNANSTIERELNNRPRAILDDRSPTEIFTQLLTSTTVPMLQ